MITRMFLQSMLVIAFLFTTSVTKANKDDLAKAWESFKKNDRDAAINGFKACIADPSTKEEAYLGLCLSYWEQAKTPEAFENFMNFYKASSNPYPYVYALWTTDCLFSNYGKKSKEQLALLNTIIADPRANSTIKGMAQSMVGYHYESIGDFKKALVEFNKLGTINNWQVVGTFENISGSGFNKDFQVLQNPKSDAEFKNSVDAKVNWFEVKDVRNDKWFDFSYHFVYSNSIMYAQTFVMSDVDQDVILRSGVSGSLKIWLNDNLVVAESEERNADLDLFSHKVKLNKGYNRILVQVGESEADRANFLLRFTDMNDKLITNLQASASYQDYTKAAVAKPELVPFFAEDYFIQKLKSSPDNLIDLIMLSETYLRNDKAYESRKTLSKVHAQAPTSTFIAMRLLDVYSRQNNTTEYTTELENIKKNDPNSWYALNLKYEDANKKEDFNEAEEALDKIISLYGNNLDTDLKKIDMIARKKNYDELYKSINTIYKKYPDEYSAMALKYLVETSTSKDLAKGNAILKKYLTTNYSDKVLTSLAENFFKLGNVNEGLKIYQQRVNNRPYAIGDYQDMADLYFGMQNYDQALEWQQKTLAKAPYHGYYYEKVGKILEAQNKSAEAKTSYQKAIYYDPTNYASRKQIAIIDGKKDEFSNFKTEDVYEMYKNSPSKSEFPDDNSLIILNDRQRIVYPEGASEEKDEILIKVFDQAGIDNWKEYYVGYNQYTQRIIVDKSEVLKANGNRLQAEYNGSYFVFTSLEPGDAIHLSYRIEDYQSGQMALHFSDDFNFNYFYPTTLSRYSIMVANNKKFNYNVRNADIKAVTEDVEGYKKYTWEMKNAASLKSETVMPTLNEVGARLELSSIPDWQFVANWYSDLASTKAKSDFEVQETVQQLFAGKSNLKELEKAKIIYDYIEKNMTYSNVSFMHSALVPQKASRCINTKLGDCKDFSTLFVAMGKEVGLKANLVLVNTRDNGENIMNQPTIGFNHCIVKLEADGKPYIIELTDQKLSFASMPSSLKNSSCLIIPREGEQMTSNLIKIESLNRPMNASNRETKLTFMGNDMIVDRKTVKEGEFARSSRGSYADIGKDKQEESMTQAISKDFTTPVKLTSLTFSDLKSLTDTVTYKYTFTAKNAVTEFSGIKLYKLPWADAFNYLEYFTIEKRNFPFNVWELTSAESEVETMTIEIPKGKILAEQPKALSVTCPAADYSLTYKVSPTKVVITRTFKVKKDVVPTVEYTQLKDFFSKVVEADAKQFGFKNAAVQ
jgi:hypothetical protein